MDFHNRKKYCLTVGYDGVKAKVWPPDWPGSVADEHVEVSGAKAVQLQVALNILIFLPLLLKRSSWLGFAMQGEIVNISTADIASKMGGRN